MLYIRIIYQAQLNYINGMSGKGVVSIDATIIEGKDGLKKLTVDADALRKIMESNIKVAQRFEKKVFGFAALTTGINAVNSAFGQLASTVQSITGESEGFNRAMKEANTMAGKDSAGFERLKGEVADLAKEIPIARDQLANGLYQTISNGVPEDNWIEYLKTSARSAVGGLADINKVVGVTSTLIKNYGLEWGAAADIQDKIQLTAKNGVTSFEQLARALPSVAGNAATLGVSIDELMGTFATLTGVSGNTAEVSTQLGAIFTALVKPSSEAAEMAAKMGIRFDAAAIKAAGGFQNFLSRLNDSVKSYAQANGVLEQEVYGKLFGSAEAIRALIPLQGELADKFTANVANMVNSAGTMDAAYADMSSHGEAVNQMLRNQWAAVIDVISGFTSAAQPYINFTAGLLSTGSSAAILITTFKQLNRQQMIVATRAKLANVAMASLGPRGKSTSATLRVLSAAMKSGAYSATALKIALRGLLIATGIGAAIAGLVWVISELSSKCDDAAESVDHLKQAEDERVNVSARHIETLNNEIKSLKLYIDSNRDSAGAIKRLNDQYGDIFGNHKTAAEWYDVLTKKSRAYAEMLGYEAQMKMLTTQTTEDQLRYDESVREQSKWMRSNRDKWHERRDPEGISYYTSADKEFLAFENEQKELQDRIEKNNAKIEDAKSHMSQIMRQHDIKLSTVEMNDDTVNPSFGSVKDKGKGKGSKANANAPEWTDSPQTLREYTANIEILKKQLLDADKVTAVSINRQIAAFSKEADAIRNAGVETEKNKAVWHDEAKSIAEVEENLRYLNAEFDKATTNEARADINGKIEAQQNLADYYRGQGKTKEVATVDPDAFNLKGITANIAVLNEQLQSASEETAATINKEIEAWEKKADAIRNAGKAMDESRSVMTKAIESIGGSISSLGSALELPELNVVGTMAQAIATMVQGYATATAQAATMGPFAWLAFAATGLAQLTGMVSAVKSLPAFANGGIVSGPTVGLIGEYAGASNNPEVVAPLDKLRGMLNPVEGFSGGTVKFKIDGRTLVGVLEKENNLKHRS